MYHTRRIMIVDDDISLNHLINRTLKRNNFEVDSSFTGKEAVEYMLENPNVLLLVDHQLPDMNGMDIIQTLKNKGLDVNFVVMTGQGDERLAVGMMKLGAADYLIKDINLIEMLPSILNRVFTNIEIEQKLKSTEEELVKSKATLNLVLNNIPQAVYWKNEEGVYLGCNQAYVQLVGYKNPDQVIGKTDSELGINFFRDSNIEQKEKEIFNSTIQKYTSLEPYIQEKGNKLWLDTTRTSIVTGKNLAYALLVVHNNITERIQQEKMLKDSEKELKALIKTKDKLFSIIAHDLRSPFNSIIGLTELVSNNLGTIGQDEIQLFLSTMHTTAQGTLDLLENLLIWAKSQTGQLSFKPEKIQLESIIKNILIMLESSAKLKNISIELACNMQQKVVADKNMIESILHNLITNAIKFTNKGGYIKVCAEKFKNEVKISIADNGIGMSNEIKSKLFRSDIYFTTSGTDDEVGSGLGLLLCKEFTEKNGGQIWAESEPGVGSTFSFTIPIK